MPIRCRRKLRALVQFHGGNYRNRYVLGSEGTQPIEHGLRPSPHQKGHDVCVQACSQKTKDIRKFDTVNLRMSFVGVRTGVRPQR